MGYRIDHKADGDFLSFEPDFTATGGRYNFHLGQTGLNSGKFPIPSFEFDGKKRLTKLLKGDEPTLPAFLSYRIADAQGCIRRMMDELFRWQDIAEIVKESRKPQKEG